MVENYYENFQSEPIDAFAFDFWQNTKYVYRDVDAPDSQPVQANEEQMDKDLSKIQ
ncbi:hypothetical protein RRU94_17065 [Domibacillus sp. DTU_2020_1001157_1_SI_ALB_TIR_016]|uniref:hypothetical protein n=1 Tax=Domibacillus sp. DTU_2020_1001157_1_SI_ALB_TIR_016 TaxID=3077789 RepID=UPI0028E674EC|nr:hypothetical protein [Domibacillus sp. DTU_2020_1001157_1_SI_ALB_TIR_016]WNS79265.1 hypothetical protein RRU94_17065 [Domibacillus sp. DTU_2020_1001157_1_SI_ALB_TIR_016]